MARLAHQVPLEITSLWPPRLELKLGQHAHQTLTQDLNSGLHACVISTYPLSQLPTQPYGSYLRGGSLLAEIQVMGSELSVFQAHLPLKHRPHPEDITL